MYLHFRLWSLRILNVLVSWFWYLSLMGGIYCGTAHAGDVLEDINFSALPGGKVQLRIVMQRADAVMPKIFATDAPPKLVLDFPDTSLAMSKRLLEVGVGAVHNVATVASDDGRVRVVVRLDKKVNHILSRKKNIVLLTLDSALAVATERTEVVPLSPEVAPASSVPSGTSAKPVQYITAGTPEEAVQPVVFGKSMVNTIDFRRGKDGEGRVLITMNNSNSTVNLKEDGKSVILEVLNTQLASNLQQQKLDVVDFATPVQSIVSEQMGGTAKVSIVAVGEYGQKLAKPGPQQSS